MSNRLLITGGYLSKREIMHVLSGFIGEACGLSHRRRRAQSEENSKQENFFQQKCEMKNVCFEIRRRFIFTLKLRHAASRCVTSNDKNYDRSLIHKRFTTDKAAFR